MFDVNCPYFFILGIITLALVGGVSSVAYADNADAAGDILVADSGNHRIQVFNPDHSFKFQFGSSGSGDGQFNTPWSTAIAQNGDILVVDQGNHRIQIFNSDGTYKAKIGSSTSGAAGSSSANGEFDSPRSITITSGGDILVADTGNNRIQVFNPDYSYKSKFGSTGSGNGQLNSPRAITVAASSGDILVSDYLNKRIHIFDSSYAYKAKFDNKPILFLPASGASAIAVGADGDILASTDYKNIAVYDSATYAVKSVFASTVNQIRGVTHGIAVALNGDILFTDSGIHHVQVFGSDYAYKAVFGSSGSGDGQFNTPYGITVVTVDNTPPKFDSAALDEETGVLAITFNEIIANEGLSTAPFDLSKLFISESGSASGSSGVQLSGASIETVGNSTSIEIKLTEDQRQSVILLTVPELDILEAAVFDVSGNQIVAAPDNVIVVTADNTPPKFRSATLDEETGVLAITFDEIIAASGFDLSIAAHERALSVSSQDASLEGVAFSTDGTKMFVVGYSSENIYEYTLTAPFDISDSTHTDTFSVSLQDTDPKDVAFSTDGTKMFVVGYASEKIYEYTLTAPFNISAPNHTDTFSVGLQDGSLEGMAFNPAGTKMFVVSTSNDNVSEYTLTAPFNISAPIHAGTFSVSSQDTSPTDVAFNPAGTKMFVVGTSNDNVNEYTLTAPFNISAPIHAGTFSVALQEDSPRGVAFNPAGTKMFVVGTGSYNVNEYTLATPAYLSKLFISESGSASGSSSGVQLSGASIETVGNSISIEIKMTEDQRQSVILLTTPELDILEAAVFDVSGNQIVAAPDNVIVVTNSVQPPPLAAPTGLLWSVSGTTATLIWTAPAIPANLFYDISNVSYIVNVTDVAAGTTVPYTISDSTITTYAVTNLTPGKSYQITVKAQALLTDLPVLNSPHTAVVSFAVPAVSPVPSSQPSADNTPPKLKSAALNERTGVLAVTFDEIIANEDFDLSTADYTDNSFSVSSQDTSPQGVAFNPAGTKMFVAGASSGAIHEYTLTAPFDMSNFSHERHFSVSSQDTLPTDVEFSTDGTKMFVVGASSKNIYEYTLTTPFNLDTASYTNSSFSVSSQERSPTGVAFSTDGTKMFVVGLRDNVNEYTLTAPFDISAPSHTDTFSVSSQDTSPQDVTFNPDGTRMFVTGTSSDAIHKYALTAPFDISAPIHADNSFSVALQERDPTGVAFSTDGTKMFVVGLGSDSIHEYALTNPVDLSKLLISESGSASGSGVQLSGASIETVGNSDFIEIELTEDQRLTVIALNTPELDILEAAVFDVSGNQIVAAPDNVIVVIDSTPPTFESATLNERTGVLAVTFDEIIANEGFDLSTAFYTSRSFSVGMQETNPTGMAFSTDGTKMFVVGVGSESIREYALSAPFDISNPTYTDNSFSVALQERDPSGVAFSTDGTKMFVVGTGSGNINEYALTAPFDISAPIHADNSFSVSSQDTSPQDVTFNPAGTKMFVAGAAGDAIYEYALTAPFDISNPTYTDNPFSVASQDTSPSGVAFNPAGTKMFVADMTGLAINEYTLSAPFDISDPSHTDTFSVSSQDEYPEGMAFNPAGTKMFVVGADNWSIYEYALTTPVDLSKLFISESESANDISLTGARIATVGNSDSIEIELTEPQRQSVIALITPELDILAGAVSDVSGNAIVLASDNHIAVTADNTPPTFRSAALNEETGVLAVTWDETITDFDLSTAFYTSRSFSVSSQDTSPSGVAFNPDGTRMFVAGASSDAIHEYELSAPFDISAPSFVRDFSVLGQDYAPTDVAFNPAGTKMFVTGLIGDNVYEYTLSAPFDISHTTTTHTGTFSVSAHETNPRGMAFSTDGTKMFVTGTSSDSIHEYALSAPFDISAPIHAGTFPVSEQDTSPADVAFSTDGTRMFVAGMNSGAIHEYALTAPFDISDPFHADNSFSVSSQDTSPRGVAFNPAGTRMFVAGADSGSIYEYALENASPTDLSKLLISESGSASGSGVQLSGASIATVGNSDFIEIQLTESQRLSVIALTTPELDILAGAVSDVSGNQIGAAPNNPIAVTADNTPPKFESATLDEGTGVLTISWDETVDNMSTGDVDLLKLLISESGSGSGSGVQLSGASIATVGNSDFIEIELTEPQRESVIALTTPELDILAGAVSDVSGNQIGAAPNNPIAVTADNTPPKFESATLDEGTGVLAVTWDETIANEGFDISTAAHAGSFSVSSQDTSPQGVAFNPDGTKMFVADADSNAIYEYELSVPFDISSLSSLHTGYFSVFLQDDSPTGVAFNPAGTKMFVAGATSSDAIHEYKLSDPFSVSTAFYTRSFSVSDQERDPRDVAFNPAGTKMFVAGADSNAIHEYALSDPFDVSSSSHTRSFSVSSQDRFPTGVAFNSDGTRMFVAGMTGLAINEYTLSAPFDISAPIHADNSFSVASHTTSPTGVAFNPAGTKMFVVGAAGTGSIHVYALTTPVDLSKLLISESGSASGSGVQLSGASIETVGSSTSIEIKLTALQLQSALALDTPELDILEAAVFDDSGNAIAAALNNVIEVTNNVVPPLLDAPTDLSVAVSGTTATITWTAPAISANSFYDISDVSYIVYVVDVAAGSAVQYTISDGTITTYTATNLTPDKSYQVTVKAQALLTDLTILSSQPTAAVSFAVSEPPSLDAPTNLLVNVINGTTATITWTAPTVDANSFYTIDDISYTVEVYNPGIYDRISEHDGRTTDTSYTITGLTSGESYRIVVYAVVTVANYDSLESFEHVLFNMPVDSIPPKLESAALNKGTGVLAVTFDEIITNEGFDLSTAVHTDRSFSVGTQETSPTGMAFSTDGIKMFVAGAAGKDINEYTLSDPFDVSTLTFVVDPFSVSAQDATPADVAFNTDGTKMFVVGNAGGEIHEYALSDPFDVSSSVFADDSFSVSDRVASPTGMAFSTDGTKMFVISAQHDRVYEYALSDPFDVSSSVFADVSFSVSDQDTTPADVAFNTDGTKMFVVGNAGDAIHEYALSAPFDISAPTHAGTFSVALQEDSPRGVAFNPAGTKMFVVGNAGGEIHEYALASSLDLSKLFISESGSASGSGVQLSGASIETVGSSTSIEIKLTALQLQSALALDTPQLDILKGAVSDVSGNQIGAAPNNVIEVTSNVVPPLDAPTDLSVAVSGTTATITWTAPAISANSFYDISDVSYIVNVTDVAADSVVQYTISDGTTTTHTATNLTPDTSYQVTVEAQALLSDSTILSSQPTAAVSFAVSEPPSLDAPTNLLVNVINGTTATITWTAPTVDINDFYTINDVTYQVNVFDSINAPTASSRSITDTSYTATGLTPGESYNVFVSADAAVGSSYIVQSVGVSAPFDMPAADAIVPAPVVVTVNAAMYNSTAILLTWTQPPSLEVTGYNLSWVSTDANGFPHTSDNISLDVVMGDTLESHIFNNVNPGETYYFTLDVLFNVEGFPQRFGSYDVIYTVPVDSIPPKLELAALNEGTRVLAITFDEIIANEGFDISTAAYIDNFPVGTQDTTPAGMAFNTNGTKMFVAGLDTKSIYEYTLTTPFDVSSSSYIDRSFPVSDPDLNPRDVAFNTNGTKMFVVDFSGGGVYEYALTTPFDLSTASYANSSVSVSSQDANPTGVAFNPAGTKMFVVGTNNDTVYEYTLGTPFDLSIAAYANSSFLVSDEETTPTDVAFNTDGTRMFVAGTISGAIHEYKLTAPFDISNPSHAGIFQVSNQDESPHGVAFNTDGTKMFVVGASNKNIYEYKLATPVDLSKLFISESGSVNEISLTGASIETVGNSASIEIKLTAPQLQSALELTTPELDIMQAAVSDVSDNQIDAAPNNHITIITGTGRSSGGGSSSSSTESTPPSFPTTSFDGKTDTIFIGTVGISPEPSRLDYTLDNPVLVQTGQSIPISLTMHDNISWESISHVELCLNKQISNNQICDSDTKLVWDKKYNDGNNNNNNSNSLKIIDPNGLIENASVSIAKVDVRVATWDYSVTFGKAMDTSDIQIYAWDDRRNALTFTIHNALTVTAQNNAQGSSSSSDTASSDTASSSGGSSSSSSGGSSSSSSSSDTITSSCDAGKLLLDNGLCMDPEPGTFACLSEQVMNHDGTCLDASKTAIAQDDDMIKLLPPSSDTQSTDAIKKQNEMIKRWAGYSEFSATDAELIKSLGITNDLPPDVSLPKWIKKHLGEMVYKNQISVEQLKTVLSYMVGVLK